VALCGAELVQLFAERLVARFDLGALHQRAADQHRLLVPESGLELLLGEGHLCPSPRSLSSGLSQCCLLSCGCTGIPEKPFDQRTADLSEALADRLDDWASDGEAETECDGANRR